MRQKRSFDQGGRVATEASSDFVAHDELRVGSRLYDEHVMVWSAD